MSFKVYDFNGYESTYDWLRGYFGDVVVEDFAGKNYAVSELRARDGDAAVVVKVEDAAGNPVQGARIAWYWPDAPADPDSGWYRRCVFGNTNAEGCIGFGMGEGAYYQPPGRGPHAVWVYGEGQSQLVDGLGMVWATNHEHINVTFEEYVEPVERYHLSKVAIKGRIDEHPPQPPGGYLTGTPVQLSAVPDERYHFLEWDGSLSGSRSPESLIMDGNKSVIATFAKDHVPPPSEYVKFFNVGGVEQDAAWAEEYFGKQEIVAPDAPVAWRVVELIEENLVTSPDRLLTVVLLGTSGDPAIDIRVRVGPINVEGDVMSGVTDAHGIVSFYMSDDFIYYVPGQGNYGVAVVDGDSEVYKSVGVALATPRRWLNVTFMLQGEGPPEYPDEELRIIIENIEGMLGAGREFLANLANIKAVLQSLLE